MKLVITGIPDIGKTTIAHIMECEFTKQVAVCADAIELIQNTLILNPKSPESQKCYQRALYHMQVELENMTLESHPNQLLICDHGTLDCLVKWPDSPQAFFNDVHSSLEQELSRYDWVIQINGSTPVSEMASQQDFQTLWRLHPHFFTIPAKKGFSFCYLETARIIKNILSGASYKEICKSLSTTTDTANRNPELSS